MKFYYFDPDSPQSNLVSLKHEMDSLLASKGLHISFQPFAHSQDFNRKIREAKPAFCILPSWYLLQDDIRRQFTPILKPTRHGITTYRKVLLIANGYAKITTALAGKTMAVVGMGSRSFANLNRIIFLPNKLNASSLSIITTTKDIDALFALVLHQVDAALVSKNNIDYIRKINPRILKDIHILAESQPIPLPILCVAQGTVPTAVRKDIEKLFLAYSERSGNLMDMLQIEGWQYYVQ